MVLSAMVAMISRRVFNNVPSTSSTCRHAEGKSSYFEEDIEHWLSTTGESPGTPSPYHNHDLTGP